MISYAPLRNIMDSRGVSYRQLRRDLGIHPTAATLLKNDSGYVLLYAIEKLCAYFEVEMCDIVIFTGTFPESE